MKTLNATILILANFLLLACSPGNADLASTSFVAEETPFEQVDLQGKALASFKLTDAPNKDLKSVVVDIDHLEVLLSGGAGVGRLILAKGLGPVDLLKLQNGVTLPLQDVAIPHGVQIQQIRLVLKNDGHFAVKGDNSLCELKTPGAQKTGIKIILANKFIFEAGHAYSILVDFDALKSVVVQGNGRCLLKPVLKLKSATKTPIAAHRGQDSDNSSDDDSISVGPGEVLVPTPEVNDSVDDGWDYTPVQDGNYPVLTADQLANLL